MLLFSIVIEKGDITVCCVVFIPDGSHLNNCGATFIVNTFVLTTHLEFGSLHIGSSSVASVTETETNRKIKNERNDILPATRDLVAR